MKMAVQRRGTAAAKTALKAVSKLVPRAPDMAVKVASVGNTVAEAVANSKSCRCR